MGEKNSKVSISNPAKPPTEIEVKEALARKQREIDEKRAQWLGKFEQTNLRKSLGGVEKEFGEEWRTLCLAMNELLDIGVLPEEAVPQFVGPFLVHVFITSVSKASELEKMRELLFTRLYAARPFIGRSSNEILGEWAEIKMSWELKDNNFFELESVPNVFFSITGNIYDYQQWHRIYAPKFVEPQVSRMKESVGVVSLHAIHMNHLLAEYLTFDGEMTDHAEAYYQSFKERLDKRRSEIGNL